MSRLGALACCGLLCAPVAFAASPMQDLLSQVQQAAQAQQQLDAAREAQFLKARDQQAALVAQAEAELHAEQSRSDALRGEYENGQRTLAQLQTQLQAASADRGQVDAAVRDAARDFAAIAGDSLISAQLSGRREALAKLADPAAALTLAQLRSLWFLLEQQLVESGRVVRFPASYAMPDGSVQSGEVLRIGEFVALADDHLLVPAPGSDQLAALSHQPGDVAHLAAHYQATFSGLAPMLVDPSRGALMRLQAARPSVLERIRQGGWVGYVIIVLGVVALALALYQLAYLMEVHRRVQQQLSQAAAPRPDNPLGRVLSSVSAEAVSQDPEALETRLSEAVLREAPRLERFQPFLRVVVAAGPLLGLLGTVTGMILTFQVITEVGAGDPKLMAGGISQAMVTTVLGLIVAIPILFINSLLSARSRVLIQILDEQSAGLLARRLEEARRDA